MQVHPQLRAFLDRQPRRIPTWVRLMMQRVKPPQQLQKKVDMSIETQATIAAWARETFPGGTEHDPIYGLRMLAEVVEACLAMGSTPRAIEDKVAAVINHEAAKAIHHTCGLDRFNQWLYESHPDPSNVGPELGGVQITLYNAASRFDVDLGAETDRGMAINRGRRWQAHGDGTGQHLD